MIPYNTKLKKPQNDGQIFYLTKELKQLIDCLKSKALKIFHLRKELLQRIDCLQCKANKIVQATFRFPI